MKTFYTILTMLLFGTPVLAQPLVTDQVQAELIANQNHIQPGETIWVGVSFKLKPHWHLYWKNPGDSGLAPEIEWDLPDGFTAGDIQWPAPTYLEVGGLASFAYEENVFLTIPIHAPADLPPGVDITLNAELSWLVCKQMCLPGSGRVSLTLPVSPSPAPASQHAEEFSNAWKAVPLALPIPGSWAQKSDGLVILSIPAEELGPDPVSLHFFPFSDLEFKHTAPQTLTRAGDTYTLQLAVKENSDNLDRLQGILISASGWSTQSDRKTRTLDLAFTDGAKNPTAANPSVNLPKILFLGFIGGLILNLMPCVFPVLGLKIMGFVEQAGASRAKVTRHGLWFTAGVLVSFWILAGALIAVRAAGHELGWGFQLQSPLFVYILALFLFLFALNLSGVFEIGTTLTQLGAEAEKHEGYAGSFMSGILATLVATPCAAPFLAGALGTALTLPPAQSMIIFTSIGLGLSAPYLILSMFPTWVQKLPRPGAWMETFKQFMAFLLYATVAYLIWIVLGQVDPDKSLNMLMGLVVCSVGAWVYGRFGGLTASKKSQWITRLVTLGSILVAIQLGVLAIKPSVVEWEKWSPERVSELQQEGRTVYVDFTARWCVTCKANKLAVFSSKDVINAFNEKNIAALKADWTNQDPKITRALAAFNRSAVPFNLVYKPGQEEPIILPEILTPSIVLDAILTTK